MGDIRHKPASKSPMALVVVSSPGAREWLWRHLLDAELNCRYWRCMVQRYKVRDQRAQIFLAVATSGAVAGWTLWESFPLLWQVLSAASSLVAVTLPVVKLPTKVEAAADLYGRWTELSSEYERLWALVQDGAAAFGEGEMEAFARREAAVAPQESAFTLDARLAERCQAEVKRQRGLK